MFSVKLLAIVIDATVAGLGAVANALWGPRAQKRRRLARAGFDEMVVGVDDKFAVQGMAVVEQAPAEAALRQPATAAGLRR